MRLCTRTYAYIDSEYVFIPSCRVTPSVPKISSQQLFYCRSSFAEGEKLTPCPMEDIHFLIFCGRAVQNIMFEGKIRRRELILELQHADVVLAIKEKKDKEREADLMLIHR